jgi:hypothetical protein
MILLPACCVKTQAGLLAVNKVDNAMREKDAIEFITC